MSNSKRCRPDAGDTPNPKRCRPDVDVIDGVRFGEILVKTQNVTVEGGFHKKRQEAMSVTTESFRVPGDDPETAPTVFFHLAKTEGWFGRLVSGHVSMGRGVKSILLLDLIRSKIKDHFRNTAHTAVSTAAGATGDSSA